MTTSMKRIGLLVAALVGVSLATLPAGVSLADGGAGGSVEAARAFRVGKTEGAATYPG